MRILVGTLEIGRMVHDLAEGFRRLGHHVDTVMTAVNPYFRDLHYNYGFSQTELGEVVSSLKEKPHLKDSKPMRVLNLLLSDYDVYVFIFASSLLPDNLDFPLLKSRGKKIISLFNGSDVRHWSAAEPVAEAYGYRIPSMCRTAPFNNLKVRLGNIRRAERFADAVFSLPFQSELAIRPYHHILLPVDLSLYEENIPARDVPVLVHAPSRRNFKGTEIFLAVLDRLRGEGVEFELNLLENTPNKEVLRSLVDADVVLDELHAPHFGMLALEGMASGCAVVAGYEKGYVPLQGDSPVYAVREENLYERLKQLLTDKELRLDHARRGREFVRTNHDHVSVAAHVLSSLDSSGSAPDYYPTFFAKRYNLPEGDAVTMADAALTAQIVQRWGLPSGVRPEDLTRRRLSPEINSGRPIVNWKPPHSNIIEEIWGWSPLHRDENAVAEENSPGLIIQLAQQALAAVSEGDHESADEYLQACISYADSHPDAFEDIDALVAVGRLAQELGETEIAEALFSQAYQRDPDRQDLNNTSGELRDRLLSAA